MTWRPNLESSQLLFATQTVLNNYEYDITLKQLYYILAGLGEIEMSTSSYRKLSTLMLNSRKYGRVKPDLFVEKKDFSLKPPSNLTNSVVSSYHIHRLEGQPDYLEIWVDKSSFASFVKDIVAPYDIEVFTSEGFSPYSFTYSAYSRLMNAVNLGKIPRVMYLSDFEPSSIVIFDSILTELAALLCMTTREASTFVFRTLLTPEHIVKYQLPYETLVEGPKTPPFEEKYSDILKSVGIPRIIRAEIESIEPSEARRLILNAVFAIIDYGKVEETVRIENSNKLSLAKALKDSEGKI